ncbi:MAG TPA: PAS domain S-box protein [Gemmatimonadaceae bacterium]|nr:PAS domain S-box protein [Gemmatimonadaceae bacterium]
MRHSYDAIFVILSVIVAMLASFAALDLAGRVRSESGATRLGWIAGGATVMGLGIWSMHFVGMLAFHLPVPIWYDVPLMLLSVVVAIAASLLALIVINRPRLGFSTLVPGGMLMGGAIAGMHYIGMASVRADARLTYTTSIVALSVLIAIVASLAALWLAFRFRSDITAKGTLLKVLSAVIMGIAISGMHYTAMAAARFAPSRPFSRSVHYILASGELGGAVVVGVILIIVLALVGAVIDRNMQARAAFTRQLAEQTILLGKSEQQYRLLFRNSPNSMWLYAPSTGAFLAVNEAALVHYGYTREEFLAMTLNDIRVEAHAPSNEIITFSSQRGGAAEVWNGQHRKNDGTLIDVVVTSQAIVFDGREAFLALVLDVTDSRRAEEALRESEHRTRLIVDTALDAVITMDAAGRISVWNTQAERMFGWSREEALGQRMAETIIPSKYRDAHVRGLKKFLETGEGPVLNRRIEITAVSRDGVEFPVELAISPAKLGSEWTFSAFIRDLSEQKKAAEALRLGEQRYRELFEDIPVGLYRSTPEGSLIDANPAMASMLGYPDRESLLEIPATALYVDPADRLRWSAEMTRAGVVRDFEVQMRRADGAVIWARDTTHAKREADGKIVLYQGVIEDITDRIEAEQRLQSSERRLVQILEAVPVGIFVSDHEGHPLFANAGAQKILGKGAVPGLAVAGLAETYKVYLAGTDQLYPVERLPLVRALSGETSAVDDMEIRQGGLVISLNVQGAPILDNEGKVVAAVAAFFNTTDRRSLEAQLRQSQKMEAIGRLAGGVAHDFNNILTVIRMSSEFLLEDLPDTNESRHEAKEIMKAADRAAALTRQLLAFSRHQVLNPRLVVLNEIVEGLDGMLRRVVPENIEVKTELEAQLGPITADTGQLEQVLLNLVINAADAMPNGGRLNIRTSNVEVDSAFGAGHLDVGPGSYVCLTVSDTGHGMDRETASRIFDPFFTTKPVGKGTGLGLATVHGIVTQTGGKIWVYSEPGQGTTFKIFIPRSEGVSRPVTPRSVKKHAPATETILLVEDEAATRDAVQRSLLRAGYKVLLAANGVEALTIADSNPKGIDLVLTDSMMPEMGGLELVSRLRKARPDMSVLMMSGYTEEATAERFGLTALPFIEKPFASADLLTEIQRVLHGEEDPVATG